MRFYQTKLLYKRSFAPFFCTQFLGAFNDNFFKTAVLTALTFDTVSWTSININLLNNLIAGIFILPFFLFSASAGQIADKFEKSQLIRIIKVAEVIIICIASIGWYTHNIIILMLAIMAMGIQSAAFGPIKYSYLPQHFDSEELLILNKRILLSFKIPGPILTGSSGLLNLSMYQVTKSRSKLLK